MSSLSSTQQDTLEIKTNFEDPAIWQAVTDAIGQLNAVVWDDPRIDTNLARAEGVRYLTRLIAGAIPMTMECANADYPAFLKFLSTRIQYGLPAADALYQWAPVHGDHVYRIHGTRGSAHMFDFETRTGHFAHIHGWTIVDRSGDFELNDDGTIDIVLSHERQPGNWIKIPEGPGEIVYRQYFYDWLNEEPAQLTIRREGATWPAPPLTEADVAKHTQLLIDWLQNLPRFFQQQVASYYESPKDAFAFDEIGIGWADLRYGKAIYECAEDEALIIEVTPPEAPYWSMQLFSQYWDARDWNLRQTSINGHQAELDEDGVFRAVICHQDPGVSNWLDAAGHETGLLSVRYFRAQSTPVPTIRRIKLDELNAHIPKETPFVSAEQRSQYLQKRAESVIRRGCL